MVEFLTADQNTWKLPEKRVNGYTLKLCAIQKSRRTGRKGRTKYIYHLVGTGKIVYNRSRDGVLFMPIASNPIEMIKYHQIFVESPLTEQEKVWLKRYDYSLVGA